MRSIYYSTLLDIQVSFLLAQKGCGKIEVKQSILSQRLPPSVISQFTLVAWLGEGKSELLCLQKKSTDSHLWLMPLCGAEGQHLDSPIPLWQR